MDDMADRELHPDRDDRPRSRAAVPGAFRRYDESLPIALLRAREAVMTRFRPHLARRKLTDQQWRVIRVLAEAGALDATELANRCCILTPSLSRIVKALAERGLVSRDRAGGDARRLDIALTGKGLRLFDDMAPESVAIYQAIEEEFGTAELDRLLDTLRRLRTALDR